MSGPQAHVTGNGDKQRASSPQDARDLGNGGLVVLDVLEHVERHRQVHAPGRKRQRSSIAAHGKQATPSGQRGAVLVVLDRGGQPPVIPEHPCVAPTSGTDVNCSSGAAQSTELVAQQVPALSEPPVTVLDRGRLPNFGRIHLLSLTSDKRSAAVLATVT